MKTEKTTDNIDEIKSLIDAFYKGETSVEQEQILLNYFEGENVDEDLCDEKELFLRMFQSEPVEVLAHLESKLSNLIDQLAEEEKKVMQIHPIKRNNKQFWIWTSSAACVILLVFAGFLLNNNKEKGSPEIVSGNVQMKDTFTDPKKAQVEVKNALVLLSLNYNKGVDQLAIVSSKIDKTNKILDKSFKHKKQR